VFVKNTSLVELRDSAISPTPLVSVVIPTRHRPTMLSRALTSVFNQTYQAIEVIVVVDGPDDHTIGLLRSIEDPRLNVIVNPRSLTAAGARNIGVDRAKGKWIAFLDDDDEWLPSKIETQMRFTAGKDNVLISCLSRVVSPRSSSVQPLVIYDNLTPLDEYLFDRRSPFAGVGFVQTSSYLLPQSMFERVRFRIDNPHDDWDFLLRVSKVLGARIETVPEVLVVLHVEEQRPSLSTTGTWVASLHWIDSIRSIVTRRAYGGFCLGVVGPRAVKERAYAGSLFVLYRSFRYGSPRLWRVCALLSLWVLPAQMTERIRSLLRTRNN
jgi:glycosyltransferase involved in cell wall biosynthesis